MTINLKKKVTGLITTSFLFVCLKREGVYICMKKLWEEHLLKGMRMNGRKLIRRAERDFCI